MSFKKAKDAIDEHIDFITALVLSGGEPASNPFFLKIIQYAKSKGLKIKINTNGLVYESQAKNIFLPYIDYMNISIKGTWATYKEVLKSSKVQSIIPRTDILEYSFVYSPTISPDILLKKFHDFLKNQVSRDSWYVIFSENKWSEPDIFTVSQMQTGDCLNNQYNDCRVPTREECVNVAELFQDIPKKKVIIETKEFGREEIILKK